MDNFQFDTEKLAIKSGWACSGICTARQQVFQATKEEITGNAVSKKDITAL
jgi:hypothetical protein